MPAAGPAHRVPSHAVQAWPARESVHEPAGYFVAGPGLTKYLFRQLSSHHAVFGPGSSSLDVRGRPGFAYAFRFVLSSVTAGIDSTLYFGPLLARIRSATLKYV